MQRTRGLAIVRGGGDIATGVIYRLWRSGFKIVCLETESPLAIRRTVSAAQAVYDGSCSIEGMHIEKILSFQHIDKSSNTIDILVDPHGESIKEVKPDILIDAIMAKRNLGTRIDMAPLVIALGPGFSAPEDVHAVIETKRGHYLGRMIVDGKAIPDTGIPGIEMGFSIERLLKSPAEGKLETTRNIGDKVQKGDLIGKVGGVSFYAEIDGVLRGLIHPSVKIKKGLKIGDIDPRNEPAHCYSITDKALAVAGGVLEAIFVFNAI